MSDEKIRINAHIYKSFFREIRFPKKRNLDFYTYFADGRNFARTILFHLLENIEKDEKINLVYSEADTFQNAMNKVFMDDGKVDENILNRISESLEVSLKEGDESFELIDSSVSVEETIDDIILNNNSDKVMSDIMIDLFKYIVNIIEKNIKIEFMYSKDKKGKKSGFYSKRVKIIDLFDEKYKPIVKLFKKSIINNKYDIVFTFLFGLLEELKYLITVFLFSYTNGNIMEDNGDGYPIDFVYNNSKDERIVFMRKEFKRLYSKLKRKHGLFVLNNYYKNLMELSN